MTALCMSWGYFGIVTICGFMKNEQSKLAIEGVLTSVGGMGL